MKKIVLAGVVCSAALSFFTSGVSASAAENEVTGKARVEFKEPDPGAPVDPVDPEDPDPDPILPVDPGDEEPPVYPGGPLRINHIPTLSFGVNDISASQATYLAQLETVYDYETKVGTPRASFVEVADLTGSLKGWKVTASSSGVFESSKGNVKAVIKLLQGNVRGLNGMDELKDKFPEANQAVTLGESSTSAEILTAKAGKGYNKWQVRYGDSSTSTTVGDDTTLRNPNVTLTVPQGQIVLAGVTYTAKITWSLEQGL